MANWTFVESPSPAAPLRGRAPAYRVACQSILLLIGLVPLLAPPALSTPTKHGAHVRATSHKHSRAEKILMRALLGAEKLYYSGEQTILTFNEGDGAASVTRETHLGPERYRIDYQNPPDMRGCVKVANGESFGTYLPSTHILLKRRMLAHTLTQREAVAQVDRIRRYYTLVLSPHEEDLDGYKAYLLDVSPRHADRPRQRIWIDKATGFVLRRETYSPGGTQTSVTSWRDLHFYRHPNLQALHWIPPRGTHTENSIAEKETRRIAEARRRAGPWARVPDHIGDGFVFESAHLVNAKGTRGLYCVYSDGLNTLSLVQLTGVRTISDDPDGDKPKPVKLNATNAQETRRGPIRVLSWESPRHPSTVSLIGELSEAALIGIAKTLL